jgi:hypothetical protein
MPELLLIAVGAAVSVVSGVIGLWFQRNKTKVVIRQDGQLETLEITKDEATRLKSMIEKDRKEREASRIATSAI